MRPNDDRHDKLEQPHPLVNGGTLIYRYKHTTNEFRDLSLEIPPSNFLPGNFLPEFPRLFLFGWFQDELLGRPLCCFGYQPIRCYSVATSSSLHTSDSIIISSKDYVHSCCPSVDRNPFGSEFVAL